MLHAKHKLGCEVAKVAFTCLQAIGPELGPDLISLITSRDEINDLLKLDDVIDLVIPRCVREDLCVKISGTHPDSTHSVLQSVLVL